MPGLTASFEPVATATAKFDLSLSLGEQRASDGSPAGHPRGAGIRHRPVRSRERGGAGGAAGSAAGGGGCGPERAIGSLDILAPDERHTILQDVERHRACDPVRHLAGAVRRPGCAHPGCGRGGVRGESLTYGELDARANQLAHHLRALGVGPETVVGLCVERSPEMLVGLLGILKAGGAYLPLDPAYPHERLAFMLEDAGAPVLVTQSALLDRLPAHGARIVRLDADWPAIAAQPITAPALALDPHNTAYVIYTSGSTGTPKGVVVTHAGLVNRMLRHDATTVPIRREGRLSSVRTRSLSMPRSGRYGCRCCIGGRWCCVALKAMQRRLANS